MNKDINEIIESKNKRKSVSYYDNMYFFFIYLRNYVKYKLANFQKEIFETINDDKNKLVVITAFRGSAKSTIVTLSYALWSILGKNKKKFILIISKTQDQTKIHFQNIISEIENNKILKNDFDLDKRNIKINQKSIYFKKIDAIIKCASFETSIRGMRFKDTRPDLIICDDIEDLDSVRNIKSRDKLESWFTSEIIPVGDKNTKIILVGNLLHGDSLIMRIKNKINNKELNGIYKEYPLLKNDKILWNDKYNSKEEIEILRKTIGNEVSFQREYMLKILPDDYQIIQRDWIKYYEELPYKNREFEFIGNIISIDLAISKKETADYTAILILSIFRNKTNNKFNIFIRPNPINKRLSAPEQMQYVKDLYNTFKNEYTRIIIESVAYQLSFIQNLKKESYPAEEFKVQGQDKTARLNIASLYMQNEQVFFPKNGCEDLINQLLGFGVENNHDDLVDAFSMGVISINNIKDYKIITI